MIPKLEMLLALAKERHFGHAAQSLGIAQPTLSAGIRQLEEQLGVRLVNRGSRFGGLTPEGQRTLLWARRIVGDSRQLRDEMRSSHTGLSGHLRIAVIPTALTWTAQLTARFGRAHPNVNFTVLSRSSAEILELIENLDVDAGMSYLDNEPLGRMRAEPLYRENYCVVCGPRHALAQRDSLSWADLEGLTLCLLTPDMQNRRIVNRGFREAGIAPRVAVEANSTIMLVGNVLYGGHATILPTDLAGFLVTGHDLVSIPVAEAGPAHSVGLIALHQEPQTPVMQALMKSVSDLRSRF